MKKDGKSGQYRADLTAEDDRRIWDGMRPVLREVPARRALAAIARYAAIIIIPFWWQSFREFQEMTRQSAQQPPGTVARGRSRRTSG